MVTEVNVLNTTSYSRSSHVTLGIPFPQGQLTEGSSLVVDGATNQREWVQWYPQGARWPDNSVKYARATFPVNIGANTEKSCRVIPSNGGVNSNFTVPIQSSINNTRLEFSFKDTDYYKPAATITGWSYQTVSGRPVTRVTFSGYSLRSHDVLRPTTESYFGYFSVTSDPHFFVQIAMNRIEGTVYAPSKIKARRISSTIVDLEVQDPQFTPDFNGSIIIIGIWSPSIQSVPGVISLDLSSASLIESGADEAKAHYRRYRLFKRGTGLPGSLPVPIWTEVVFDVYKNSSKINFWFSWGNNYSVVSTIAGGDYKQLTYYFDGQVKLEIKRINQTNLIPRVAVRGSRYQAVSLTELNSVTTLVCLDSDRDKFYHKNNITIEKTGNNNIPNGFTLGYKGTIVYSTSLTNSERAELVEASLSDGELLSIATTWNDNLLPPYFSTIPLPPYISSESEGKTRLKTYIDSTETSSYALNQPLQLGNLTFGSGTIISAPGGPGVIFNALPAYWLFPTKYPYPLRLLSICVRQEFIRPIWRVEPAGDLINIQDHFVNSNTYYWTLQGQYHHNSQLGWLGVGPTKFNGNPVADPAPLLQGTPGNSNTYVSLRTLDQVHATTKDSSYTEGARPNGNRVQGYDREHWSAEYPELVALLTMDYLFLRYCEVLEISLISENWSQANASWLGNTNIVTRAFTRPSKNMAMFSEILDNEFLRAEIGRKIIRVRDDPGHEGYLVDAHYGDGDYSYLKPYDSFKQDNRNIITEYCASGWMEGMGVSNLWALWKVLNTRADTTAEELTILRKVLVDMSATFVQYFIENTRDHGFITLQISTNPSISDPLSATYPETGFLQAGDVLEVDGNSALYTTVDDYAIVDNTQYITSYFTDWVKDSRYGWNIVIFLYTKDSSGDFSTGMRFRNTRTGNLLRSGTGVSFKIQKTENHYRPTYSFATSPEPGVDVAGSTVNGLTSVPGQVAGHPPFTRNPFNWVPRYSPNYYTPPPENIRFSTRRDYTFDYNPNNWIEFKRGTAIKPLTEGLPAYVLQVGGVPFWPLGALTVAVKLANENAYGAWTSAIRTKAQAAIDYTIATELGNTTVSTWEHNIWNNLFIEDLTAGGNTNYTFYASVIDQLITIPSASVIISSTVITPDLIELSISSPAVTLNLGSAVSVTPSLINLKISVLEASIRTATSTDVSISPTPLELLIEVLVLSNVVGVYANNTYTVPSSIDLNISCLIPIITPSVNTTVAISSATDIDIDVPAHGVRAYTSPGTGQVFWKRRLQLGTSTIFSPEYSGIPGGFGDPANNGYDIALGQAIWETIVGKYYTEEDIIGILGYDSIDTSPYAPGYKIHEYHYISQDLYDYYTESENTYFLLAQEIQETDPVPVL